MAMKEHLETHMNGKASEFLLNSVEYVIQMVARFRRETKLPPFDWNTRRYPKWCYKNSSSKHIMEAISHSIRRLTPHVTNERGYGYTFVIAFHDMASTVLRMNGERNLRLSPQVLIDAQCNDVQTAIAFATQQELGLESLDVYPFIQMSREIENWSESDYQSPRERRYRLDDVKVFVHEDEIISAIVANFRARGPKYPLVGILKRNDFTNRRVATIAATGRPYRFPVNAPPAVDQPGSPSRHAVLIVGVDTTSEDPTMHFCEVKGSHGTRWGVEGFSKVGFEVFDRLLVPVMND